MTQDLIFHELTEETAHLLRDAEVFDNALDPEQLRRFVADAGHMMVFAMQDGDVIGMASGTVLLHPPPP